MLIIEPCAEVQLASDRVVNVAYPLTANAGTLRRRVQPDSRSRFPAGTVPFFVSTLGEVRLASDLARRRSHDFGSNATLVAFGAGTKRGLASSTSFR